jgi:hypothetical protein
MEQTEHYLNLLQRNQDQQQILDQLSEKLQRLSGFLPPTVLAELTQIMQKLRQF